MKIVHVASNYPPSRGGVERVVAALATKQSQVGHEVTVITTKCGAKDTPKVVAENGVKVVRLPYFGLSGYLVAPQMTPFVAKSKADIIHFHGLAAAGSLMGCMLFGGPKVCTAYFHPASTYDHQTLMGLALWLAERQSGLYHSIMALTERERTSLKKITGHSNVVMVPIGINLAAITPKPIGYQREAHTVLFVGRLASNKGLTDLIRAIDLVAKQMPTVRLVIVGRDCGELANSQRLVEQMGLKQQVVFLNEVSDKTLDRLFNSARLLVLPSRYESFGLVVMESLARGTPVVVSSGVALADDITQAECGLVFPYGNVAQLATCINRLISDNQHWTEMSQRGQQFVQAYSWDHIVGKVLKVYARALQEKK